MSSELKKFVLEEVAKLEENRLQTILMKYGDVNVAIETRDSGDQCREKAKIAVNALKKIFPEMKMLTIEL